MKLYIHTHYAFGLIFVRHPKYLNVKKSGSVKRDILIFEDFRKL